MLSNLEPQLYRAMERITYYRYLNRNPHFSLRDFSTLIKRAIREGISYRYKDPLCLGGVAYSVSFDPISLSLSIEWTEGGELRAVAINVIDERSNLSSCYGSSVYYFLCPRTGLKCRKLYRIGSNFWSRRAFRAVYPQQMESRLYRNLINMETPYKKYGKETYRGQLTPYGKRCMRFSLKENRWLEAATRMLEKSEKQ